MASNSHNPRPTRGKKHKKRRLPNKLRDLPGAIDCFDILYPEAPSMTSGPPQDENIPVDDSAGHSTTPPQSQDGSSSGSSSDEETSREDADTTAAQYYTGNLPTPGPQGHYRSIIPRQPVDNQSSGHAHTLIAGHQPLADPAALNQNQNHHEWLVQMEVGMQYQPSVQGPQDFVGIPPWGGHTFYPDHNTFFVPHPAGVYTDSAQMNDYGAYSMHNQGHWTGPPQDNPGSSSG